VSPPGSAAERRRASGARAFANDTEISNYKNGFIRDLYLLSTTEMAPIVSL